MLSRGAILVVDENVALFAPGDEGPVSWKLVNVDAEVDFDLLQRIGGHAVRTDLLRASCSHFRAVNGVVQLDIHSILTLASGFNARCW